MKRTKTLSRDGMLAQITERFGRKNNLRLHANAINEALQAAGLEHKSLKTKGIAEDAAAVTDQVLALITDAPTDEQKQQVAALIAEILMRVEPTEVEVVDPAIEEMEYEDEEDDEEKALRRERTRKEIKLMDRLITSQGEQAQEMETISTTLKAFEGLPQLIKDQGEAIKQLKSEVEALKGQLEGRPRVASQDPATALKSDSEVAKSIEESFVEYDPFFPSGTVKKEVNK